MIHNQLHTVDLVIIGAYLIAMVMVGLVVVRKVKNMDDYYLGGRSFGPLVLMATVCATIIPPLPDASPLWVRPLPLPPFPIFLNVGSEKPPRSFSAR